jgi:hypothetical protein
MKKLSLAALFLVSSSALASHNSGQVQKHKECYFSETEFHFVFDTVLEMAQLEKVRNDIIQELSSTRSSEYIFVMRNACNKAFASGKDKAAEESEKLEKGFINFSKSTTYDLQATAIAMWSGYLVALYNMEEDK